MPGDGEFVEAERLHHLDLVERQRPLRIIDEIRPAAVSSCRRSRADRDDDGEVLGQKRRHLTPHHMRLRVAVDQQQRRPVAADDEVDRGARRVDAALVKPGKKSGTSRPPLGRAFQLDRVAVGVGDVDRRSVASAP